MRNFAVWLIVVFVIQDAMYHMLEWLERREARKQLADILVRVRAIAVAHDRDRKDASQRIRQMLDVVDAMRLQVMTQELQRDARPHDGDQRTH